MILQSLRDLAFSEGLLARADYQPKAVAWVIAVGEGGCFLHVSSTASAVEGEKPRAKTMYIPWRAGRAGTKPVADFLVDNSEYVLGAQPAGRERAVEQLRQRRDLFAGLVERAAREIGNHALTQVAAFLRNDAERGRCVEELQRTEYKSNDLFTFEYRGQLVHEAPEVSAWFSATRQQADAAASQCLVCGRMRPPVDKHPAIRVPGGTTSGIALVSFNSNAFESYGLDRNENAPVCRECADAYTTALNRLLSARYTNPAGETLPTRYVRLTPDTTAVFWADAGEEVVDLFHNLFDAPNEDSVKALFEAPWKGRDAAEPRGRFFCLAISGAQGRAVLRGVHTGTVEQVEENVRDYFSAMRVEGVGVLALFALLRAAALQGKLDNLPPGVVGDMFLAIVSGRRFSRKLLDLAVERCRTERGVTRERAALVRACLSFKCGDREVKVSLDKDDLRPGYRMGRLLSVLEQLQRSQRQKATIVERFYGAASARPATVFPGLIRLAQHHLAKSSGGGFFQGRLGEVLDGVDGFPATLNLEQQGLFALGYYHQRQEFIRSRPAADETAADNEQDEGNEEE